MADGWKSHGACRGRDQALWYPETFTAESTAEARRVCADCPVQTPCLEYALMTREADGIWGGLTPTERASLAEFTLTGWRQLWCVDCEGPFVVPNRGAHVQRLRCDTCREKRRRARKAAFDQQRGPRDRRMETTSG